MLVVFGWALLVWIVIGWWIGLLALGLCFAGLLDWCWCSWWFRLVVWLVYCWYWILLVAAVPVYLLPGCFGFGLDGCLFEFGCFGCFDCDYYCWCLWLCVLLVIVFLFG